MAWWKKVLLIVGLFTVWLFGLFFLGAYGYADQYLWFSISMIAIGAAMAPFWRFRSSMWYRSAVTALVLVHFVILCAVGYFMGYGELPSKGIFQAMILGDCMASWIIAVGICWVATRQFPWQLSDR